MGACLAAFALLLLPPCVGGKASSRLGDASRFSCDGERESTPRPPSRCALRGGSELSAATAPSDGLILRIEFSGLRRVLPDALRARIASRVGQPLNRARITADVRALDRLGWFDSVVAEVYPVTGVLDGVNLSGARLVFRVEERPFLARVEFHGSRLLSRDKIGQVLTENQITLKTAAPVDGVVLWRAARAIEQQLADLGHPHAQVRLRLEAVPVAAVRATFDILDGPHITVARVTFVGNRAFSDAQLRHQMKRVAPSAHFAALRGKDVYTRARLADDLDRLAGYYRDHGYARARLGQPSVQINEERVIPHGGILWPRRRSVQRFHISIPVDEGNFYRLAALDVASDFVALPDERLRALPALQALQPGEPYSQKKIERAREVMSRLRPPSPTKASASPRALPAPPTVDLTQQLDPAENVARIAFRLREAQPYIVRRLEFLGHRKFSDRYYRRHVLLKEGEPFDPARLEAGLAQIARAGFIRPAKKEDVRVAFDDARHTADVAVRVQEIGEQRISFTGGRSNLGSTVGIAYNVFDLLGGEELITAHLEGGPPELHAFLDIAKEGVFGTRASLVFRVFEDVVRPNLPAAGGHQRLFTSRTSGLSFGETYPVTPSDSLGANFALSREWTQYTPNLPSGFSNLVGSPLSASTSTSHSLGLNWTHQDGPQRLDTTASVSGGWLGGTENLIHPSVEYAHVYTDPFTEARNSWAFRGYAAGVGSFRGNLPIQDRLFGGDQLVRGFRSGELAPYGVVASPNASGTPSFRAVSPGANLLGAVNTEYRVPLASRTQAVGFFDAGSGWLVPNWLGPLRPASSGAGRPALLPGTNGALRASTGLEMRWTVPVVEQTLRLDLAANPWRLARSLLLPDGSHFRPPNRPLAWNWSLGSLF